mgnify:CR=1 FL=1
MDSISIIDLKLNEIASKIKKETKNIKIAQKQCDHVSRILTKS